MPYHDNLAKAFNAVRGAWYSRRSVVPVVGAGLSLDAGIPIVSQLVPYFGKLGRYLAERAYLPPGKVAVPALEESAGKYVEEPWRYSKDFGWPDPYQLQQELLRRVEEMGERLPEGGSVEDSARIGLDRILTDGMRPGNLKNYQGLKADIERALRQCGGDLRQEMGSFRECLAVLGDTPEVAEALRRIEAVAARVMSRVGETGRSVTGRLAGVGPWSTAFDLVGDWKRLIQHFTRYRSDYADAFMTRLCAGKAPSLGHRYLAFLVKLLPVNTVFTFNFDHLIEQSLAFEGVRPKVFAMEEGRGLPHHSLARDEVCLLKLHGSSHAMLLDERVDHPMTREYLRRFDALVGEAPLLLVVGCSGDDYRLRSLVEHVLKRDDGLNVTRLVWFHFEPQPPSFLQPYLPRDKVVIAVPTNNPGAALHHLYTSLTGRHPASKAPYTSHVQRPVLPGGQLTQGMVVSPGAPFLVSSLEVGGVGRDQWPSPPASEALIEEATDRGRRGRFHVVWVDLEAAHTLAAVVGSILDQCRRADTALSPSVLPLDDHTGALPDLALGVAVQRVRDALRRGRYFVAIDGLEAYLWPPTAHHGETTLGETYAEERLRTLVRFLRGVATGVPLTKEEYEAATGGGTATSGGTTSGLGESVVAVSVDRPETRTTGGDAPAHRVEAAARRMQLLGWSVVSPPNCAPAPFAGALADLGGEYGRIPTLSESAETTARAACQPPFTKLNLDPMKAWALILLHLGAFRRTRTPVALRAVFEPAFRDPDACGEVLKAVEAAGLLKPLEGGNYWFNRPVRDEVYARFSEHTQRTWMSRLLGPQDDAAWGNEASYAVTEALLLSSAHNAIARAYYTNTFAQSGDCQAFLEYTYHRISSVRYLTRLLGLIEAARGPARKSAVRTGVGRASELFRAGWGAQHDHCWDVKMPTGEDPTGSETRVREWLQGLKAAVGNRHSDELYGLYRSWTRAEVTLRSQVPAEQLLLWCTTLADDDLKWRCNGVVLRYEGDQAVTYPGGAGLGLPDADFTIRSFRGFLGDLRVKLLIERSDYATCEAVRQGGLKEPASPGRLLHAYLDLAVCSIKTAQGSEDGPPDFKEANDWLQRTNSGLTGTSAHSRPGGAGRDGSLDNAVGPAPPGDPSPAPFSAPDDGLIHEAWLRLHHLKCEVALEDPSVFARPFLGHVGPPPEQLDEAEAEIGRGLERTRYEDVRIAGPPRSVVLDPTPDGCVFAQYRSVFHMLRGRVEWLRCLSGGRGLAADWRERFESAHAYFELARGGLGDSNPLLRALNELYGVEAGLARARARLHPDNVLQGEKEAPAGAWAVEAVLDEAAAKYEMARFALRRARECLLEARRNVIWWRLFYLIVAQYHSDRLTHGLASALHRWCSSPPGDRLPADLPECLTRARRGFAAVRSALDYNLPGSEGPRPTAWLRRLWRELTLAAYAVGRAALAGRDGERQRVYISEFVKWLSEAARLAVLKPAARDTRWFVEEGEPAFGEEWKVVREGFGEFDEDLSAFRRDPSARKSLPIRKALLERAARGEQTSR